MVHTPWSMTEEEQEASGCVLGRDYPVSLVGGLDIAECCGWNPEGEWDVGQWKSDGDWWTSEDDWWKSNADWSTWDRDRCTLAWARCDWWAGWHSDGGTWKSDDTYWMSGAWKY